MTIKKQLSLLISIITAIPIFCVVFISVSNYLHSSKRFVSKDIDTIRQLSSDGKSDGSSSPILEDFAFMPPEMEGFLISDSGEVIISTIREIKAGDEISKDELLNLVLDNKGAYFYHFLPQKINDAKTMLITRIPRSGHPRRSSKSIYIPILTMIAILVGISIIVLLGIGRNLFNSVLLLQQQMANLAAGNLETPITVKSKNGSNEFYEISEYLESMRASLLESQNKKNKFIMGISHDLRTPIAVIKGYAEALSDGVIKSKEEKSKALELIKSKTSHLENMINTLINFVKLENNDIRKTLVPKPITKLIKNFAKDAEATVSVFNRKLTCKIDLPNEYLIPLDEQLVNRVFENLLSNAMRYTSDNSEITINAYEADNKLFIKFSDTGVGISESDLANIFDLFYRTSNSRREEGMGIGLSVVKNIIETHGWKIEVESEKGRGSCFTITIPVSQAQLQKN